MPYRPDKPYVPQTVGEIMDYLGFMMLKSPTFADDSGYFPERNVETVFFSLNEGLKRLRRKIGEDRYAALMDLSDRMRTHFESDPQDTTKGAVKGRAIIEEMEGILTGPANDRV